VANKKKTSLIVTCMDRRLVEKIKGFDNDDTIIVSNAGANVQGMKITFYALASDNTFDEVRVITHEDCRALQIVSDHYFKNKRTSSNIYTHIVRQFEGRVSNESEILKEYNNIQREKIYSIFPRATVVTETWPLSSFVNPADNLESKRRFRLIVSKPIRGGYKRLFEDARAEKNATYAIIGYGEERVNDIEIAVENLSIEQISFMIQEKVELRPTEKFRDRVKMRIHRLEMALGRDVNLNVMPNYA